MFHTATFRDRGHTLCGSIHAISNGLVVATNARASHRNGVRWSSLCCLHRPSPLGTVRSSYNTAHKEGSSGQTSGGVNTEKTEDGNQRYCQSTHAIGNTKSTAATNKLYAFFTTQSTGCSTHSEGYVTHSVLGLANTFSTTLVGKARSKGQRNNDNARNSHLAVGSTNDGHRAYLN